MRASIKILLVALILAASISYAQIKNVEFKRQGLLLSQEGRYGEAIDQFNKYITANPNLSEGYHLRGLSFEKRLQYWDAVFDLRRALRLSPNDLKVKSDLDRIMAVWHKQLYQKIDGHKRDLAIDPNKAFTYLEIGKSYRWLEEWYDAEKWYDEYLKRDDNASPDEIIRYSVILAKTRSIVKGERILKKYTDRYPDDWRLWSRYGYFTMWLGKNKNAEDAFLKALKIKPFFEEAEDGLDQARKQPYMYVDVGRDRRPEQQEYAIDRFYRLLDKNPDNDEMRFDLVDELIKNNRFEEAFQQLQYLQPKHSEEEKYKTSFKTVSDYRDSTFNREVNKYTEILKNNPSDKDAVNKLADAYANLFYYDSAVEVLNEYLQDLPDNQDLDLRFKYAKYAAWNYEWEKSIAQIDKLLLLEPNNLDYKLLRAQIAVWTLNDMELGKKYLKEILLEQPKNLDALLSLVNLYTWEKDFTTGKELLDLAKSYYPNSKEVANMESIFQLRFQAEEEYKIFLIKADAGKLVNEGNCESALQKYDEYLEKRKTLTREEKIELADIATCAKYYNRAITLYDEILNEGFDYQVALLRARNYYLNNDSTKALTELNNLSKMNPDDDIAQLYLANALSSTNRLAEAEEIYRKLKKKEMSDADKQNINQQMIFLAGNYIDQKQFEKGKQIYQELYVPETSEDLRKQIDGRYLLLADSYVAEKKYDDAQKEFVTLEKKYLNEDDILNDLYKKQSYMSYLLILDKNLEKATEVLESLKEKKLNNEVLADVHEKYLFLGDAYSQNEDYGEAKAIYETLLESTTDTTQIRVINERIKWLPPSGFSKGLNSVAGFFNLFLPTNIIVSPFVNFYMDNQKFRLWNYGVRADAGFLGFLSLGAIWNRINLNNKVFTKEFTQLKWAASIFFTKYFSLSGTYGNLATLGEQNFKVYDATLRYEIPDQLTLSANYERTDARIFLYSPNMFFNRMNADVLRLNASYSYNNLAVLKTMYQYFELGDGNYGNDFMFRLGRRFLTYALFGYEYYFSDYAHNSVYYYAPQDYDTHSLWAEADYAYKKDWKFKAGGKIGYAPDVDFIISEIFGEATYKPLENLIIAGRATYGNSFRYGSGYKSISASLTASWSIF